MKNKIEEQDFRRVHERWSNCGVFKLIKKSMVRFFISEIVEKGQYYIGTHPTLSESITSAPTHFLVLYGRYGYSYDRAVCQWLLSGSMVNSTGLPPEDSETATPFVGSLFFPSRVSDKSGRYHRIWMEARKIISHRLTLLIIPSVVHRTTRIWMEDRVIISHCWARHGSPPFSSYKFRLPPLFIPLSYACGTSNR